MIFTLGLKFFSESAPSGAQAMIHSIRKNFVQGDDTPRTLYNPEGARKTNLAPRGALNGPKPGQPIGLKCTGSCWRAPLRRG